MRIDIGCAKNLQLVDLVSESINKSGPISFHDPRVQNYLKWLKRKEKLDDEMRDARKKLEEIEEEQRALDQKIDGFKKQNKMPK